MLCATNGTMLYILPPLRTQNPPAPWSSIICSTSSSTNNNNNNNNENENNSTENLNSNNNNNWRANKPRKIQLRNLQIIHRKRDDSVAHHHDHLDTNRNSKSLSECYFAGKGTALVLPDADATIQLQNQNVEDGTQNGNSLENGLSSSTSLSTFQQTHGSSAIQKHLQSMFYLLRPEETLKMAVKLESVHPGRTRYLVVVSRMGNRGEESCLLGIDCNEETTVGLVLRVLADTKITLDGDGGFSVSVCDSHHIFKPVSVQAMWSALQTLHKVSEKARDSNYFQGGGTHSWVEHYEARVSSDRSCLNEWHAMDCLESRRPPSPDSIRARPTKGDETEKVIRSTLKEIMMSVDLDEVTSKFIRTKLEEELDMNLGQFKSFIDQEMLIILGQMDAPTEIFDHVYLGSEWNASNYEELQRNGVGHILNVTREIDNFFPGTFDYLNVRVYDDDKTDLLKHWDDTFKYITKARNEGSKVLVHCKMGISRSASVVIAYAMKAYNWDFPKALLHVRDKRTCIKPNTNFLTQLETYQGILDAMKNKEKLQRSKSETNLKSPTDNNNRNKNKKSNNNNNKAIKPVESEQINSNHLDDFRSTFSGQDLRQMGERPKSWSPDNLTSREIKEGVKTSPASISLEDLRQKSSSNESVQETKASLAARHVLMPCDNGESYSVSPNRIVHLPGHDNVVNSSSCVAQKLICDQNLSSSSSLSSSSKEQSSCGSVSEEKTIVIKSETWDPGESSLSVSDNENNLKTNRICDQNKECPSNICSDTTTTTTTPLTVWTSSAVIVTQSAVSANSFNKVPESPPVKNDPFSNQLDHIFECEEKKQQQQQQKKTIIQVDDKLRECPSRQSSWSSYDSAVVLGFNEKNELSRHSSWGSGDTRVLPSRNSSWGSYDTRPRKSVYYVNENGEKILHSNSDLEQSSCGIFPYDKEDIPWHPGTVKRTKQRLESSNHRHLNNDSSVVADSCVSLTKSPSSETLLFNFAEVVADDPLITVNNSAIITEKLNIPPISPQLSSRLSVSAPESCSMELVAKECPSLSRSESNVSSTNNNNDNKVNNSVEASVTLVKRQKSFLENIRRDQAKSRKIEDTLETSQGKVQNLKKEFEAKSGSTGLEQQTIIIQEADKLTNNKKNAGSSLPTSPICIHQSKEQSQKILSEDLNFKTILSVFESKKDDSHHHQVKVRQKVSSTKPSSRNNNARYSCFEVFDKKNSRISSSTIAPFISNLNNKHEKIDGDFKRPPIGPQEKQIGATIIAAAAKKQQQFGKTHPLARINIKSRHNNPVYNTM